MVLSLEVVPKSVVEDKAAFCAVDEESKERPNVLGHCRADAAFVIAVSFEIMCDRPQKRRLDVEIKSMDQKPLHIVI